MTGPTLQEIDTNLEAINENLATLNLKEEKGSLVLYGNKDIHFPGLIEDVESLKVAIKNINGMPQQVEEIKAEIKEVKADVSVLVETDKKRVWFVRGAVAGYGILTTGVGVIIVKVFS